MVEGVVFREAANNQLCSECKKWMMDEVGAWWQPTCTGDELDGGTSAREAGGWACSCVRCIESDICGPCSGKTTPVPPPHQPPFSTFAKVPTYLRCLTR